MEGAVPTVPGLRFEVARTTVQENPLRTDIAGFAGPTLRGPVGEDVRVEGWSEYVARFGGLSPLHDTAFAIQAYFENGGEIAHVVRTAAGPLMTAATEWQVGALDPISHQWLSSAPVAGGFASARYRFEATSPGTWANGLKVKLGYRRVGDSGRPELDLLLLPELGSPEKLFGLSPERLEEQVADRSTLVRLVAIAAATPAPGATGLGPLSATWGWDRAGEAYLAPLSGGGEAPAGAAEYRASAAALAEAREVALIGLPDIDAMAGGTADRDRLLASLAALVEETLDRQVVVAAPRELSRANEVSAWRDGLFAMLQGRAARNVAVYHPWVDVEDPFGGAAAPLRRIAPVGHVAGVISRLDRERGAHHTPANASVHEVVDLGADYSESDQARLVFGGINLLRCKPGHGFVLWGGRTLADPHRDPENLFLAHRRLGHRLVRAIRRVAAPLIFESNEQRLWLVLVRSITAVLMQAYRAGALKGERPEQAFRIVCDESNNTTAEIDAGLLQCEVLVAPAVPMEFIKLRIAMGREGRLELIEP